MKALSARCMISQIADEARKFFIGISNAPIDECIRKLAAHNYSKIKIITNTKNIDEAQLLHNLMLEIFKRKGNFDKKYLTYPKIEGNTLRHKMFVAYQ